MLLTYIIAGILILFNITSYFLNNKSTLKSGLKNIFIEILFILLCMLSAYLMAKIENLILNTNDGRFSLYGIILLSPLFVFIICKIFKINILQFYENHIISIIFGIILLRVNCIYNGCCIGKYISPNSSNRYHVREIEIILNTCFLCFYFLFKNRIKVGFSYPIYMVFYGIIRFIIQFFRSYDGLWGTNVAFGHIWSIVSIVAGIVVSIILHFKNKKVENTFPI